MIEDFEIIGWPDIQYFMDTDGFEENTTLINPNDNIGIGSSTYLVSIDWLKAFSENEDQEDTNKDWTTNLK